MFSSVFLALFLAGSMVSQVFSSKVLLVAFDSVNAEFISTKMPDLDYNGPIGRHIARPARLKSENPTLSFSTLYTLATGIEASRHAVIANKMFDDDNSVMFNTRNQFGLNGKKPTLWNEATKAGKKTAVLNWPGYFFERGGVTNSEEYKYKMDADWKSLTEKIINWFKSDGIEFGMAYFEDTNRMETVNSYIDRVQKVIKDIYNGLEDTDVDIIIMSNYGTKNVHKDHVLKIDDFVSKDKYHYEFISAGPISFMKFNDPNYLPKTYNKLEIYDKFDTYKGNGYLSRLSELHLDSFRCMDATLVLITRNGYVFYDQNKYEDLHTSGVNIVRENGFDKIDRDMDGILLLKGPSFMENIVVENAEIEFTEVHKLTKRLLGLQSEVFVSGNYNVNDIQNENKLSENMRKLIKDEILNIWDSINWIKLTNMKKRDNVTTTAQVQYQTSPVPASRTNVCH